MAHSQEVEAEQAMSALLGRVARGERLTITQHGKPVAQMIPFESFDQQKVRDAADRIRRRGRQFQIPVEELIESIRLGQRF